MMDTPVRIGFLGAGGIAQAHAYALDSLKYYYKGTACDPQSRRGFANT